MSVRVTLVIGGSGGLGSAICETLASEGRTIFLTYRAKQGDAQRVVETISRSGARAEAAALDLCSVDEIQKIWEAASLEGTIDSVVYAAGPAIPQQWFSKITAIEWQQHALAEISGFFNLAHVAVPRLRSARNGALVATTSLATERVIPGDILSAAPKAGIEMMVRQLAREEGRFGVRANCVAPGIIDAGLGLEAQRNHYTPEIWEARRKEVPLRRFGTAQAIADAVAFLLSNKAAYITGQTLVVDGGLSL